MLIKKENEMLIINTNELKMFVCSKKIFSSNKFNTCCYYHCSYCRENAKKQTI